MSTTTASKRASHDAMSMFTPKIARSSPSDEALRRTLGSVAALGLTDHLLELETQGYTTVKGVLSPDRVERAKAAILRRVERKTGRRIDPQTAVAADFSGMQYVPYLLYDDPVFQEILLEPGPLALISYLLGESCLLSSMGCHFRGPGGMPLFVHADTNGPAPYPTASMVANCNYALTPYSREAGALAMFPGSHRLRRQPTAAENFTAPGFKLSELSAKGREPGALDDITWIDPPGAVTMTLDPGDAVIWHGATWHGGFRRELPGVRVNLAAYFCRPHITPQERHFDTVHQDVLDRHANEPRFARLLGGDVFNGWREDGPDYAKAAKNPRGLFD